MKNLAKFYKNPTIENSGNNVLILSAVSSMIIGIVIYLFVGTDMFQYKIQELIHDIGKDFWIKSLLFLSRSINFLISICVFLSKIFFLKKSGFFLIIFMSCIVFFLFY